MADGRGYTPPVINSLHGESEHAFKQNPITRWSRQCLSSASDNCDTAPASKIVSITVTKRRVLATYQITGNLTANLAATRESLRQAARIYTITVATTDASGNTSKAMSPSPVPQRNGNGNGKKP